MHSLLSWGALLLLFSSAGWNQEIKPTAALLPRIMFTSFSPTTTQPGKTVVLNGAYFNHVAKVYLNGVLIPSNHVTRPGGSNKRIELLIPAEATTGRISLEDSRARRVTHRNRLTVLKPALLSFSETTFRFQDTLIGQTAPIGAFTITNTGETTATSLRILPLSAPFYVVSNSCAALTRLAPQGKCSISISFSPTTAGLISVPIRASYHDGVISKVSRLRLSGLGLNPVPVVSSLTFESLSTQKLYPRNSSTNTCSHFGVKVLDQYANPMAGISLQLELLGISAQSQDSWGELTPLVTSDSQGLAMGSFCSAESLGSVVLTATAPSENGSNSRTAQSNPIQIVLEPLAECAYCVSSLPQPASLSPREWLQKRSAPRFATGHTLPPLSRWGWVLPFDARKELAERWGYALEFSGYTTLAVVNRAFNDPTSDEAKIIKLMEDNPGKYKLATILSRWEPGYDSPSETWLRDAQGAFIPSPWGGRNFSPEMPVSVIQQAAYERSEPLRLLRNRVPISIILNGGEYMLNVPGWLTESAKKDPTVVAAKGTKTWQRYISEQKARESNIIADAIRNAVPDRDVYIFYPMGGSGRHTWNDWIWHYDLMRFAADFSSESLYFKEYNSGFKGYNSMLNQALASRGYELKFGSKLSYHWVNAGWIYEDKTPGPTTFIPSTAPNPDRYAADLRLYEGFLKTLYASGMIGGVAGYFAYPIGGFGTKFSENLPPHWLQQMSVQSHVHAQFSFLESYLREGELLPGTSGQILEPSQPAYEMTTGDSNVHVLVRKKTNSSDWLIVAWAGDGRDRSTTVEIPELGSVQLLARSIGSVYTATFHDRQLILTHIDTDETYPVTLGN